MTGVLLFAFVDSVTANYPSQHQNGSATSRL
jgi:hypothetical protein